LPSKAKTTSPLSIRSAPRAKRRSRSAVASRSARCSAWPDNSGVAAATSRISSSLPLQCRTMSQPAATMALVRSAIDPASAFMDTSSLINKPWNPITPRITCWMIVAEVVAGWTASSALNTTCAVIAIGRSASG
jgi:hypothetical protein